MNTDELDYGGDVTAVAAAMVRHVLSLSAASLRLEITPDERGFWLHLTYPQAPCGAERASKSATSDLAMIDAVAECWGHYGDTHWRTLWALAAAPATTAIAGS